MSNFNHRLKVDTNVNGEIIDHREGFAQREYFRGHETKSEPIMEPMGNMNGTGELLKKPQTKVTQKTRTRKKTTDSQDLKLQEANKQDLKDRNLKTK